MNQVRVSCGHRGNQSWAVAFAAIGLCLTPFSIVHAAVGTLADGAGVVTWGNNTEGQLNGTPTGTFSAIAAGFTHSVGLRSDGMLEDWGGNFFGQLNGTPTGTFTAIAAGVYHNVGLRSDGTLDDWGNNSSIQLNDTPTGTFTAIAAGGYHSIGQRSDGTLQVWGNGLNSGTPAGAFSAFAAGNIHSVGLRSDGTVEDWGANLNGQLDGTPGGTFTAVAAGYIHSVGLRSNGTLEDWGANDADQLTGTPAGTFVAIAAGYYHNIGLRSDGTLDDWGANPSGQLNGTPTGTFTAIAAGVYHSVGLRSDGTLEDWGGNSDGQLNGTPAGTFVAIDAGAFHTVGLRARTEYDGDLLITGTGVKANLNRSINVAGDMLVEAPVNFFNNATATIAGKATFAPFSFLSGNGTIIVGGLEIFGNSSLGQGVGLAPGQEIISTGGISGTGLLAVNGSGAHAQLGLAQGATWSGRLSLSDGGVVTVAGEGYQTAGSFRSGEVGVSIPAPIFSPGGELRMGPAQQLRFTSTTTLPFGVYPSPNYNGGKIEVAGSASLGVSDLEFVGALTNAPAMGLITAHDAALRFTGSLDNRGAVTLTRGANDLYGDVINQPGASIVVTGGASVTFYDDVVQNGALQVAKFGGSTSTAVFLGSFTGSGGFSGGGDVYFAGDLRPGNSPATVTFGGNVGFGPVAQTMIELAGLTPGSQYDRINVTGGLALDGVLSVSLLNGFTPSAGQAFDILNWGSLSGTFASVNLPALGGGLSWNASQLYTTGVLSVAAAAGIPGDYNNNGIVDAADYTRYRDALGTNTVLPNDTTPGSVTASDYTVWQTNFGAGASAAAVSAVPEPAALGLLLTVLLVTSRIATRSGWRRRKLYDGLSARRVVCPRFPTG